MKPHRNTLLPLLERANGTFVEVGAHDGGKHSFSLYLEKALGWEGLLIEPWPHLFHRCRKRRKHSKSINAAAVDHNLEDSYIEIQGLPPEISIRKELDRAAEKLRSADSKQQVIKLCEANGKNKVSYINTDSITRILDKSEIDPEFDMLILNLKGYEDNALEGFDFNKYQPTFILAHLHNGTLSIPNLPVYYERIASSKHDERSKLILFRYADFGMN